MVSEAGGKAVRVEEKDGLGVVPEASRPQGSSSLLCLVVWRLGVRPCYPEHGYIWDSHLLLQMEVRLGGWPLI